MVDAITKHFGNWLKTQKPTRKRRSKRGRKFKRKMKLYRPQIGRQSAIMSFKRSRTEVVDLTQLTGQGWSPTTGGGIARSWAFSLSELNDVTDFTNLFKYYKIKAVRVQAFFSNNITSQDEPNRFPNSQLLIYTDTNQNGVTTGITDELYYLDSQTAKKQIAITTQRGPAIDHLHRVKLANEVYRSSTNSDYTMMSPKWISTADTGTPHYGMNMLIERVDGQELTAGFSNTQYVKFIYTYYIQCKKVQ